MFPVAGYSLGRFRTRLYCPEVIRLPRPAAIIILICGCLSSYKNAVKVG